MLLFGFEGVLVFLFAVGWLDVSFWRLSTLHPTQPPAPNFWVSGQKCSSDIHVSDLTTIRQSDDDQWEGSTLETAPLPVQTPAALGTLRAPELIVTSAGI